MHVYRMEYSRDLRQMTLNTESCVEGFYNLLRNM